MLKMIPDETRVDIDRQSIESRPQASKRPYESPSLIEWGSIVDLTRGPKLPTKDFPAIGGTRAT
jgi:hypothetical protein